jgi:hypothetical protein
MRSMSVATFGRCERWRSSFAIGSVGLTIPLLCACGHAGPAARATHVDSATSSPVAVCAPSARLAMARFLGAPAGGIALAPSTGNNAMPQCSFRARVGRAGASRRRPM